MSADQITTIATVAAVLVGAIPIYLTTRKSRRTRHLVWDEIIGHDAAPGVPYKPSMSERITTLADHTDAKFATVNNRLRSLEGHATAAAQSSERAAAVADEIKDVVTGSS